MSDRVESEFQLSFPRDRAVLPAFVGATRVGVALTALALAFAASGCKRPQPEEKAGAPGASAPAAAVPAPIASGIPMAPDQISRVVNPDGKKAYSGPAGKVFGVVTMKGDPPPELEPVVAQIKNDCAPAREVYGQLFREGPGRTLADVFVAVTGYDGYVPPEKSVVTVSASGCAWSTRTVGMTFGQRLEVVSKDRKAYVPDLMGASMAAQIVALPGGSGSALYPESPGRYLLVDSMRIFSRAEVLVVKYATHSVTGLDGKFSIENVPAGKVTLSAILPATGETVERSIEINPSRPLEQNLEFNFDAAKYREAVEAAKKAGAAPSAAPTPATSR
ncbi:MAG: hypothetical protein ACOY0T_03355 [Myxococcota bacterium]